MVREGLLELLFGANVQVKRKMAVRYDSREDRIKTPERAITPGRDIIWPMITAIFPKKPVRGQRKKIRPISGALAALVHNPLTVPSMCRQQMSTDPLQSSNRSNRSSQGYQISSRKVSSPSLNTPNHQVPSRSSPDRGGPQPSSNCHPSPLRQLSSSKYQCNKPSLSPYTLAAVSVTDSPPSTPRCRKKRRQGKVSRTIYRGKQRQLKR